MIVIHLLHLLDFPLDGLELLFFDGEAVVAVMDAAMDAGDDNVCADDAVENIAISDYASPHSLFDIIFAIDALGMERLCPMYGFNHLSHCDVS